MEPSPSLSTMWKGVKIFSTLTTAAMEWWQGLQAFFKIPPFKGVAVPAGSHFSKVDVYLPWLNLDMG